MIMHVDWVTPWKYTVSYHVKIRSQSWTWVSVYICLLSVILQGCSPLTPQSSAVMASDTVYQFTVKDIDGKDVSLERYRGHVLCIVNVASKWGKTDANYTQMVQLASKYPQLRILLFPCNQFGGQEPGAHEEIKQFASKYNFKVRYWDTFECRQPYNCCLVWYVLQNRCQWLQGRPLVGISQGEAVWVSD